jgi:hypothetical protein
MKKVLVVLAAAFATVAFYATPALADQPADLQCAEPAGSIKFDSGSGTQVVNGVTITWGGTTVSVSGGSATLCVKAGNGNSGSITLSDGQSYTVNFDLNPQGQPPGISHIVVYSTTQTTTTTTTTTTGGPTSTTTAGPTTSTTTAGPTTSTTSGGPTSTTAGPTTGSGGVLGGSTTGGTTVGTTGGTAPSGGNLPFTGLPIWVPLLAAASLLASGIMLIRRRKGEIS